MKNPKKIGKLLLALLMMFILIFSSFAQTVTLSEDQANDFIGEEIPIQISVQDKENLDLLAVNVDSQNWRGARQQLQDIKNSNFELYVYLETHYTRLIAALREPTPEEILEGGEPRVVTFAGETEGYRIRRDEEKNKINANQIIYEAAKKICVDEGLIEINDDGSRTIIKDITHDLTSQQKLLALEFIELEYLQALLKANKYGELALGASETEYFDKEIMAVENALNENNIRREIIKAHDFNFLTGDINSNLLLYAALRIRGYMYEVDEARLAPKTFFSGKNLDDYFKNLGPMERGMMDLNFAINTGNPFLLVGDLSNNEEAWNLYYYYKDIAAIMTIKKMIDNGEALNIEQAIKDLEEDCEKVIENSEEELKRKYENNEDITLTWHQELAIEDSYTGKITLNGGWLDLRKRTENPSNTLTVHVGKWGGHFILFDKPFTDEKIIDVWGSGSGNPEGDILVFGDLPEDVSLGQFLPRTRSLLEETREAVEDYFVDSNPYVCEDYTFALLNEPTIQIGIKLMDTTLSEEEKDRLRMKEALWYRKLDYYDLAAAILRSIPEDTTVTYDGQILVAEEVYNDLVGTFNILGISDSDEFLKYGLIDIGISLINPAQWIVYGYLAKGGTWLLSQFTWGRYVLNFTSRISARIMGLAGTSTVGRFGIGLMLQVAEEFAEEAVGEIWPPLEFVVMALTGGPDEADMLQVQTTLRSAEFNSEVALLLEDGKIADVIRYDGYIDYDILLRGDGLYVTDYGSGVFKIATADGKTVLIYPNGFDMSQFEVDEGRILHGEQEIAAAKLNAQVDAEYAQPNIGGYTLPQLESMGFGVITDPVTGEGVLLPRTEAAAEFDLGEGAVKWEEDMDPTAPCAFSVGYSVPAIIGGTIGVGGGGKLCFTRGQVVNIDSSGTTAEVIFDRPEYTLYVEYIRQGETTAHPLVVSKKDQAWNQIYVWDPQHNRKLLIANALTYVTHGNQIWYNGEWITVHTSRSFADGALYVKFPNGNCDYIDRAQIAVLNTKKPRIDPTIVSGRVPRPQSQLDVTATSIARQDLTVGTFQVHSKILRFSPETDIYVVSDLHGDLTKLIDGLRDAGLIDSPLAQTMVETSLSRELTTAEMQQIVSQVKQKLGNKAFIILGDVVDVELEGVVDRADDIMTLIMVLESGTGYKVTALAGNHEAARVGQVSIVKGYWDMPIHDIFNNQLRRQYYLSRPTAAVQGNKVFFHSALNEASASVFMTGSYLSGEQYYYSVAGRGYNTPIDTTILSLLGVDSNAVFIGGHTHSEGLQRNFGVNGLGPARIGQYYVIPPEFRSAVRVNQRY
ncbi:metallophosphoesterase [Candidatus Woesearchaeota archaeon]|nr:metallophosphoesterase [Candidatus Woesearchaeota archaeon]